MKILLVNYRYFVSGGPERYMFNLIDELNSRGHEPIPFSINYAKNIPTSYDKYFVDPLGGKDEVLFRDQKMTSRTIYRTFKRLFYDSDVEHAVSDLISDTQPEIAYVLHFLRKLSPAVLVGIKKRGLPIIVRLSDYGLVCPSAHCVKDEKPCDLCVSGNILPSVRYKCVQNSYIASALNALAMQYYRSKKFFDLVDKFVVTNDFMYETMLRAGYPQSRLSVVPTFVKAEERISKPTSDIPKIVYVGRVERIKGIHVLLHAINMLRTNYPSLKYTVYIIGSGNSQYMSELKSYLSIKNLENRVNFLGELDYPQIASLFQSALISVVPSIWYENLPNSLLESFTFSTPVIGSDIGSLSYVIKDQQNGLLFEPDNAEDLASKIKYCLENPAQVLKMGETAKDMAENGFSPETHVTKLETLFSEILNQKSLGNRK